MARKSRLSEAELAQECECHCARRHHRDLGCWLCFTDRDGFSCVEFRPHHHVPDRPALASALARAADADHWREQSEAGWHTAELYAEERNEERIRAEQANDRADDLHVIAIEWKARAEQAEAQYAVAEAERVDSASLIQRVMKIVGDADGSGIETDEELLEALGRAEARVQGLEDAARELLSAVDADEAGWSSGWAAVTAAATSVRAALRVTAPGTPDSAGTP